MKRQNYLLSMLLLCIIANTTRAQPDQNTFLGVGVGLDYGGIGLRAEFQPSEHIGLFGGVGYNLVDPCYNAGLTFIPVTKSKVRPLITTMYGYNAVIKVQQRPDLSRTYYGFTAGGGCEVFYNEGKNKLLLEILVPFRSTAFRDHYQELEDVGFEFKKGVFPVTFSLGSNFSVGSNQY